MDQRVQVLEENVQSIISRQEAMSAALVRLDGRIETAKAETLAEFYRRAATAYSPPEPPHPDRPALPAPRRRPRRPR